jgi:hypothetical protein
VSSKIDLIGFKVSQKDAQSDQGQSPQDCVEQHPSPSLTAASAIGQRKSHGSTNQERKAWLNHVVQGPSFPFNMAGMEADGFPEFGPLSFLESFGNDR